MPSLCLEAAFSTRVNQDLAFFKFGHKTNLNGLLQQCQNVCTSHSADPFAPNSIMKTVGKDDSANFSQVLFFFASSMRHGSHQRHSSRRRTPFMKQRIGLRIEITHGTVHGTLSRSSRACKGMFLNRPLLNCRKVPALFFPFLDQLLGLRVCQGEFDMATTG